MSSLTADQKTQVDKASLELQPEIDAVSTALGEGKLNRISVGDSDNVGRVAILALYHGICNSEVAHDKDLVQALAESVYHEIRGASGEACARAWQKLHDAYVQDQIQGRIYAEFMKEHTAEELKKMSPEDIPSPAIGLPKAPGKTGKKGARKKGTQPFSNHRRNFENLLYMMSEDLTNAKELTEPMTGEDGELSFAERNRALQGRKDDRIINSRMKINVGVYEVDGRELIIPLPDRDSDAWNGATVDEESGVETADITIGSGDNAETVSVTIDQRTQGSVFKELAEEEQREALRGAMRTTWVRELRDSKTPEHCKISPVNPKHEKDA